LFPFKVFLGEGAEKGEEHIVQLEVTGRNGKHVMPIVRLQQGSVECCNPHVKISDTPVTFTLLKGKGPVHIYGDHTFGKSVLCFRNCTLRLNGIISMHLFLS
jgi:nucleophosmin 3